LRNFFQLFTDHCSLPLSLLTARREAIEPRGVIFFANPAHSSLFTASNFPLLASRSVVSLVPSSPVIGLYLQESELMDWDLPAHCISRSDRPRGVIFFAFPTHSSLFTASNFPLLASRSVLVTPELSSPGPQSSVLSPRHLYFPCIYRKHTTCGSEINGLRSLPPGSLKTG
jgi:hypothetical protein